MSGATGSGGAGGASAWAALSPLERAEAFFGMLREGGNYDESVVNGLSVEAAARGRVVCRLRVGAQHANQYGTLHGACIGERRRPARLRPACGGPPPPPPTARPALSRRARRPPPDGHRHTLAPPGGPPARRAPGRHAGGRHGLGRGGDRIGALRRGPGH
jgi:hypothetical protein